MGLLPWGRIFRRKTTWFSLVVLAALGLVAVLAPWIAPHDPYERFWGNTGRPPMWVQNEVKPGVAQHPLGTDLLGRDILSRLIYGTRTAFFLAFTAIPLAALIGTLAGLAAGYAGGRTDRVILFFTDMILSIPGIMFMVMIVLIFRNLLAPSWFNGLITLVIGFAAVSWVSLARLVRVNVLMLKAQLFVEAAISLGAPPRRIITHHLFPNVLHVILVWMINHIPGIILLEAILGYIGVGVTQASGGDEFTVISWGGLFFAGRAALSRNPWILALPSLGILLFSMSFILLADQINEAIRGE